jgi:hypothetical protein
MRYIVEEGRHGMNTYVYDTLKGQLVATWKEHHLAVEMMDDLNAIDERHPVHEPPDQKVVARLRAVISDKAIVARRKELEASDLLSAGRERESHVAAAEAGDANELAEDIASVLRALGADITAPLLSPRSVR